MTYRFIFKHIFSPYILKQLTYSIIHDIFSFYEGFGVIDFEHITATVRNNFGNFKKIDWYILCIFYTYIGGIFDISCLNISWYNAFGHHLKCCRCILCLAEIIISFTKSRPTTTILIKIIFCTEPPFVDNFDNGYDYFPILAITDWFWQIGISSSPKLHLDVLK